METSFLLYVLIGFGAQLIDGAIGMAYGTFSMAALLALGTPPVVASASVHLAEVATTGVSTGSHLYFGNVRRALVLPLALGGVAGAVLGAGLLIALPADVVRPLVTVYLALIGGRIVWRQIRGRPDPTRAPAGGGRLAGLGFAGGALDAAGGGGWGPLVVGSLLARGGAPREIVGSAIAAEWVVTTAASATFLLALGWEVTLAAVGLLIGGLPAAPLGAWAASRLPARWMTLVVGVGVLALAAVGLVQSLGHP